MNQVKREKEKKWKKLKKLIIGVVASFLQGGNVPDILEARREEFEKLL